MTLRRVAGEVPDFGKKNINEFMKAFDRFGLIETWNITVFAPGIDITTNSAIGSYVRIGAAVLFFVSAEFTIAAGSYPQVYVNLPKLPNPVFNTGLFASSMFYNNTTGSPELVPGFIDQPQQALLIPRVLDFSVFWDAGSNGVFGFGFYWL
jgi:hypothetical protein